MEPIVLTDDNDIIKDLIILCPHCTEPILIEKLNCCIFRHGILIASGRQMDPHATKELCDFYIEKKKIFGCGKPFKIVKNTDNELVAVVCEYI